MVQKKKAVKELLEKLEQLSPPAPHMTSEDTDLVNQLQRAWPWAERRSLEYFVQKLNWAAGYLRSILAKKYYPKYLNEQIEERVDAVAKESLVSHIKDLMEHLVSEMKDEFFVSYEVGYPDLDTLTSSRKSRAGKNKTEKKTPKIVKGKEISRGDGSRTVKGRGRRRADR
jgi:hypothetical protein